MGRRRKVGGLSKKILVFLSSRLLPVGMVLEERRKAVVVVEEEMVCHRLFPLFLQDITLSSSSSSSSSSSVRCRGRALPLLPQWKHRWREGGRWGRLSFLFSSFSPPLHAGTWQRSRRPPKASHPIPPFPPSAKIFLKGGFFGLEIFGKMKIIGEGPSLFLFPFFWLNYLIWP